MEAVKLLNFNQPVLFLKSLASGNLGIIDAQNALRVIDSASYEVVDGFKTNIRHERLFGSFVDVTADGEYTVSAVLGTNQAAVFSLSKRELMYKVGIHQGNVESVGIDPNGRYFLTCGDEGKSFAWVLKTSRLAFSLPPHTDYVSTVAFNDNGQWIATGSHDTTITLLNIATMKQPIRLRGHSDTVVKIIFLPSAKLLSAARNGELIVWDMRNAKVIKRLQPMREEVVSVCISAAKRFLFVATGRGHIGLYDMRTMEQISARYITASERITSLAFLSAPSRLAVGTAEGNIRIYLISGNEEKYMQMVREGQYKSFYNALEENPMLLFSKPYEAVEKIWHDCVEKARLHLEKNEREHAKEIFAPFGGVPKKHTFISQMLVSYEQYGLFQSYVEEGRYALAYSLAKQYPAFQESELYTTMEQKWKTLFFKAQELILTPSGEDQARELLAPYRGISEKTALVQQLFEQRRMYDFFRNVVAKQEYVKFFGLVKMYPFLKEFEEYTAVMEYADKLYAQALKAYASGEYSTARKACEILVSFPDYTHEAQEMNDTIRIKHLFYDAIDSNNLSNAFSYLSNYPLLYETAEAQVLERQWNNAVDKAQRSAAQGNASEMFAIFEPYFGIRDKYVAMASVMAQAYCVQLEQKIRSDTAQEIIERGIRKYVLVFGIDEGIVGIMDLFKRVSQSKLELETLKQGSPESWTPSIRIDEITAKG